MHYIKGIKLKIYLKEIVCSNNIKATFKKNTEI